LSLSAVGTLNEWEHVLGLIDIILMISVVILNYCFFNMWKILYGSYFIRPTWKWGKDIKRLKLLALQADNVEVRTKCKFILFVFYLSGFFLLFGILINFLIKYGFR
jgi:hypothetical protein